MQLTSTAFNALTNKIIDVVGNKLEEIVQESVMSAIAEMSFKYFPKVTSHPSNDAPLISDIQIPPSRLYQLRSFLKDPKAQFSCPEQVALLELMLNRTQSVLGVLGTGTGKTLTILLQASIHPKDIVTIVVLPLSSLHEDFKRRAAYHGVTYSRWMPKGKFNPNVQVISVSIEHLGFEDFIQYVSFSLNYCVNLSLVRFFCDLENMGRLGPLVFDEIHKIITDISYRDAFHNFHSLNKVKAVIFGLTGSLPPSLYPALCELTAMSWKLIRTPSSRKELKYEVVRVPSEEDMDISILNHLRGAVSTYQKDDRAIVFCRSKSNVTKLAKLFNIQPYFAPGEDEELIQRNAGTMLKWISGENPIIVSTSFLGCGFDYAHIRDVVHREPSFTMLDQYQEDSRGGRDGRVCRATTFVVENKLYRIPNNHVYDLGTQLLFDSMVKDVQCRRISPTLYLDGTATRCINIVGAVFCDVCEKTSSNALQGTHILQKPSDPQTFPPPRRSFDLFDLSPTGVTPRLDLRQFVRPNKRKQGSFESTASPDNVSSPKRVKFSDAPTYFTYLSFPFILLFRF